MLNCPSQMFTKFCVRCYLRFFHWIGKILNYQCLKTECILIIFVGVNENLTTSLYIFKKGGQENIFRRVKKLFLSPFFKSV